MVFITCNHEENVGYCAVVLMNSLGFKFLGRAHTYGATSNRLQTLWFGLFDLGIVIRLAFDWHTNYACRFSAAVSLVLIDTQIVWF